MNTLTNQYLENILSQIISEVSTYLNSLNPNSRKSPEDSQEKLAYSIRHLTINALSVPKDRSTSIAKRPASYSETSTSYNPNLSYRITVQQAYKALVNLGYLEQTKAGWWKRKETGSYYRADEKKGEKTQYKATEKLQKLFEEKLPILPAILPPADLVATVRVQTQNPIDKDLPKIRSTPLKSMQKQVAVMTSNLARINATLNRHWIDLEIPDEAGFTIPFYERQLYRVFNDRKLETGGRFFGGWWINTPSVLRPFILIDGKRTVELDYGSVHPTILYAWQGLERPTDAYDGIVPDLPDVSRDAARSIVKTAFMGMLNHDRRLTRTPGKTTPDDLKMIEMKWAELRDAIENRHPQIAHYFGTGIGGKLQKADSELAERVMLHFAEMNVPCLPIHDSFIIHHGYETELRDVMNATFKEIYGTDPQIDLTVRQRNDDDEPPEVVSFEDISFDKILKANSSCYQRTDAFWWNRISKTIRSGDA